MFNRYIGLGIPLSISSIPLYTKYASNPILPSTAINGCFGNVWYAGAGDYHAYYTDLTNVKHATSADGINWSAGTTVLTPASGGIQVSMVWKEGDTWYMLYRSNEWGGSERKIGLATSSDGTTWNKDANNPVMAATNGTWDYAGVADGGGIDPWGIIKVESTYYLWYNTVNGVPRETGLATSTDLIHWTKDVTHNPIFTANRFCAFPFKVGSYYYLLVPYIITLDEYAEGDINTNRTFELYRDNKPTFYSDSRSYLGIIMHGGFIGQWDKYYIDTPSILTLDINRNTTPSENIQMYYTGWDNVTWRMGLAIGALP